MAKSAVRFIRPKDIDINRVVVAIDRGLLGLLAIAKADFKLSTQTWDASTQPQWETDGPKSGGAGSGDRYISYTTESEPFTFVDQGTKPHIIEAKNAPSLAFQTGFVPKTRPGRLAAGPGARFGTLTRPQRVQHPGSEARDISGQVEEELEKYDLVQKELDKENSL